MNCKSKILSIGVLCLIGQMAYSQTKKKDTLEKKLDEVIVVAYGRQKRETVIGSNAQIDAKDFDKRLITNVSTILDGASPGIQTAAPSGQPGEAMAVRIRGFSSLGSGGGPLYVVDGAPVYNSNIISTINPNDIASINVLKDAASTSLYGSSAANGVVLITTKKGKKTKDVINFTTTTGVSNRGFPEYSRVNADDYYVLVWESLRNGYLTTNPTATVAVANTYASNNLIPILKTNIYSNVPDNQVVTNDVLYPGAVKKYNDFNWQQDLFKTGLRQSYDLNYSGGSEKTKYYASLGYLSDQGYVINSGFNRYTARISTDSQFTKWLKVGINLNGANTYTNSAVNGTDSNSSLVNPYYFTRRMGPIYSPYLHNPDGSIQRGPDGQPLYDYTLPRGADVYTGRNAILENMLNQDYTKSYNMLSRVYSEFKFTKNLTFTINAGYDTRANVNRVYTNKVVGDAIGSGSANRTTATEQTVLFNQLLNYKKSFGVNNLDILIGHENSNNQSEYIYGSKTKQVVDGNTELINFVTISDLYSYSNTYRKESYFARFNYDYAEKYLLSGSFRRDASSKFAPENRWANFWSIGGGWLLQKENFAKNWSWLSEFKLRGSYGQVGNDQSGIGNYAYQDFFKLGYNNSTEPGIVFGTAADRKIKWESNNQLDFGLDFSFLKNRISGSIDWYKKDSQALLFKLPVQFSSGYPDANIAKNVGSMYNSGLEFTLNLSIFRKENFGWDFNINASTLKNQITKLSDGIPEFVTGNFKLMPGHGRYDFWLRQWYGVDSNNGQGIFLLDPKLIPAQPNADNYQYKGVWVTRLISNAKFDWSGSAIPDVYGGITNTLRFKNITLETLFTYQSGGKIYDSNYAQLMSGNPQGVALSTDMLNRWRNPGDLTNVPALNSSLATQYNGSSNRWLVDASFFSIRSANLSYTFNKNFTDVIGLTSAKFYITGENLFTKTARKGLEPGQSFDGSTSNRYQPARIFSFGINVSF